MKLIQYMKLLESHFSEKNTSQEVEAGQESHMIQKIKERMSKIIE
jgi:hypothetical protein